jgi:hypothetical protein
MAIVLASKRDLLGETIPLAEEKALLHSEAIAGTERMLIAIFATRGYSNFFAD